MKFYRLWIQNPASGLLQIDQKSKKWQRMTSQFFEMTSLSIFCYAALFLLSVFVTSPSYTSILSLVLNVWQFSFIRDWPEIRNSEIPPSEFCPRSRDWAKLGIPNLARMCLIKCCRMLKISALQLLPFLSY